MNTALSANWTTAVPMKEGDHFKLDGVDMVVTKVAVSHVNDLIELNEKPKPKTSQEPWFAKFRESKK